MPAVELGGAAKNVAIGIAIEPTVHKLPTRREQIEEPGPAPAGAEHDGVTPHHRQLPAGIDRIALEADLVGFEDDRTSAIDKGEVRPQGCVLTVVIKRLEHIGIGHRQHRPEPAWIKVAGGLHASKSLMLLYTICAI